MNKNYLHTFNDLLKELELKKMLENDKPKMGFGHYDDEDSDKDKKDDDEKDKKDDDDDEEDDDGIIPSFLKQKAPGLNIDYGTAGSRITEKITLSKLIKNNEL